MTKRRKSERRGPKGWGTIFKPKYRVKDGSYHETKTYWIRYKDEHGDLVTKDSRYTNKDGAREMLHQLVAEVRRGDYSELEKARAYTVKQLTADLREHYKAMGRRSVAKLERNLDHVDAYFGSMLASKLTSDRIAEYRKSRAKEGTRQPTIDHEMRSLKTAVRFAFAHGKLRRLPVIHIANDPNRRYEGEYSREQFAALLDELPDYMKPLVRFLWCTGMRVMEPVNLTWAETNLDHGELRISGRRTKNGQQKVLYLDGDALQILRDQQRKSDHIFTDDHSEPLRYDAILEVFQQACKRAKITGGFTDAEGKQRQPGFHDLRRTFARMANRAGVAHSHIMEIVGWKSEAMLIRYLGNAKPEEQRSAFRRLSISVS